MPGLGPFAEDGLLQLDEITDVHRLAQLRFGPDVRKRPDRDADAQLAAVDDAVVLHRHAIVEHGIDDPHARVDLARLADLGLPLDMHARVNHRVGADDHVVVDVGRRGIFDRDARRHELFVFFLSHDSARLCQFRPAVDAVDLVGMLDDDRFDAAPAAAIGRDEVR